MLNFSKLWQNLFNDLILNQKFDLPTRKHDFYKHVYFYLELLWTIQNLIIQFILFHFRPDDTPFEGGNDFQISVNIPIPIQFVTFVVF